MAPLRHSDKTTVVLTFAKPPFLGPHSSPIDCATAQQKSPAKLRRDNARMESFINTKSCFYEPSFNSSEHQQTQTDISGTVSKSLQIKKHCDESQDDSECDIMPPEVDTPISLPSMPSQKS